MKFLLGVGLCLVLLSGCTGGNRVNSYAISQGEKPVKTKQVERKVL